MIVEVQTDRLDSAFVSVAAVCGQLRQMGSDATL